MPGNNNCGRLKTERAFRRAKIVRARLSFAANKVNWKLLAAFYPVPARKLFEIIFRGARCSFWESRDALLLLFVASHFSVPFAVFIYAPVSNGSKEEFGGTKWGNQRSIKHNRNSLWPAWTQSNAVYTYIPRWVAATFNLFNR